MRPKGPKVEAESGMGFLARMQQAPPATRSGSDVNKIKFLLKDQEKNNNTETKTAAYKTKTTVSKQGHLADVNIQ